MKRDLIFYRHLRDDLRRAISHLVKNPASSVSLSSGAGSKSVTYRDIGSLQSQLETVEAKVAALESSICGGGFGVNYVRFC